MYQLRDKFGWPIETYKGKWVKNLLRRLIHVNLRQTFKNRKNKMYSPIHLTASTDYGVTRRFPC